MNNQMILTDDDKLFYKKNGFLLMEGLFCQDQMNNVKNWINSLNPEIAIKSFTETEPGVPLAVYSVAHEGINPASELVSDKRITSLASDLMGDKTYLWSSKFNIKAPWCGTVEYYHQDIAYWQDRGYPDDAMLSCMIFIEKHSEKNAGLQVMPGTHKLGALNHTPFININGLSKRMIPPAKLNDLYQKYGLTTISANPGDALFFHASLVHGSSHNTSPFGRMVAISQLNTVTNKPNEVDFNAKLFNLKRAKAEYEEAARRLEFFKEKYENQLASEELTFSSPIPKLER